LDRYRSFFRVSRGSVGPSEPSKRPLSERKALTFVFLLPTTSHRWITSSNLPMLAQPRLSTVSSYRDFSFCFPLPDNFPPPHTWDLPIIKNDSLRPTAFKVVLRPRAFRYSMGFLFLLMIFFLSTCFVRKQRDCFGDGWIRLFFIRQFRLVNGPFTLFRIHAGFSWDLCLAGNDFARLHLNL